MLQNKRAKKINTTDSWEDFATNAMFAKVLFPKESNLDFTHQDYKAINTLSKKFLNEDRFYKHLNIATAQKILFPTQWRLRNKDFHSDEVIWQKLVKNLIEKVPFQTWGDFYSFFYCAQNMKILAPKRFANFKLQKALKNTLWYEEIKNELEFNKNEHYTNFTILATPLHLLEFPSKIQIEEDEWKEMEEQAQQLKNDDILVFSEFSSRRKILSAKDISITEESFDLIF